MKNRDSGFVVAGVLLVLGFGLSTAHAQANRVPEAQVEDPRWRFTLTPHLWATGLAGNIGVGTQASDVNLSFSDIVDKLDLAIMALFEARRTPWVLRADVFYLNLEAPGDAVTVNQEQLTLQPEVGRTMLSQSWGTIDLLVGARYWNLNVDLSGGPQDASDSQDWVDATVGASWQFQTGEHWRLFAKGDVGGGGSQFSWQGWGGAGYDLGSCCTLLASYRYLDVDYEKEGGLVYDAHLNGPSLGITLHF